MNICLRSLSPIPEAHDTFSAVVDSGATQTCLANEHKFESLTKKDYDYELKGIAAGLKIKGEGIVKYEVINNQGNRVLTLHLRAYYTPDLPKNTRLIPPQNLRTDDGLRGGSGHSWK